MTTETDSLEHVYGADDPAATRKAYDDWASKYEADTFAQGYWVPFLGAAYIARHVPVQSTPILDAGCGTGLVGHELSVLGYRGLHGLDLSPEMLSAARSRNVYETLAAQELGKPIPLPDDMFAAFTSFGSFGPGHAPTHSLDELIRVTRPGGRAVFNTRADTHEEQGFLAKIDALESEGRWKTLERSPVTRAFLISEPMVTVQIFVMEIL